MRFKTLTLLLLIPLILAARASARAQGFDYDAYEPRTLADMIAKYDYKENDDPKMKDGSVIFGASFPSRVKVTYTGDSRRIPEARRQFMGDWVKTHGMDARVGELFESEWKFVEGVVEYWLPVQKQVASYFDKELKKGEAVNLYAVIAGGKKISGRWDWVILVNEFDKIPTDSARYRGSAPL
jgi:hypothetical protein